MLRSHSAPDEGENEAQRVAPPYHVPSKDEAQAFEAPDLTTQWACHCRSLAADNQLLERDVEAARWRRCSAWPGRLRSSFMKRRTERKFSATKFTLGSTNVRLGSTAQLPEVWE